MENMKLGFVVRVSRQDGIGIIQEVGTLTEWIFHLSDVKQSDRGSVMNRSTEVEFSQDKSCPQFVAVNVRPVSQILNFEIGA